MTVGVAAPAALFVGPVGSLLGAVLVLLVVLLVARVVLKVAWKLAVLAALLLVGLWLLGAVGGLPPGLQ